MAKLAIFGSRTLADERVKACIREEINAYGITELITAAEPQGVCRTAHDIAKETGLPLKLYFLNFKYRRGAFEHRSKAILADTDRAILIHDGRSRGTSNELKLTQKLGVQYTYHKLDIIEQPGDITFDGIKDWEWQESD